MTGKPTTLSAKETWNVLRVHRNHLYRVIARGDVKATRVGRAIRIPTEEVERLAGVPFKPEWLRR